MYVPPIKYRADWEIGIVTELQIYFIRVLRLDQSGEDGAYLDTSGGQQIEDRAAIVLMSPMMRIEFCLGAGHIMCVDQLNHRSVYHTVTRVRSVSTIYTAEQTVAKHDLRHCWAIVYKWEGDTEYFADGRSYEE